MSPLRSLVSSRLVSAGTLTTALAFAVTAALATNSAASVTASERVAAAPVAPPAAPSTAAVPAPPSSSAPATHRPLPARPTTHAAARPVTRPPVSTTRPAPNRVDRPAAAPVRPAARPATRPATRSANRPAPRPTTTAPKPAPVASTCTAASASGVAGAMLSAINSERAAAGLPALRMNSCLVSSAHAHNLAMARTGVLSHQEVGEPDLATRLLDAGYHYAWAGENIAWTTDTSQQGVLATNQAMYDEKAPYDEHRQNILGSHYTDVGIDVYLDAASGKAWLTEDFGGMQ